MDAEARTIANGLSPDERDALIPLTCFSDAVGASMISKGLMTERDGVWNHTKRGERVRQYIKDLNNGCAAA